jgi:hypothetical protein
MPPPTVTSVSSVQMRWKAAVLKALSLMLTCA